MRSRAEVQTVLSPGLNEAPVLDRMGSQFVLALTLRNAARFNMRRDWASLLPLTGRHLVWPLTALHRPREYLARRCKGNEQWRGHEALSDEAFMQRHGGWRGLQARAHRHAREPELRAQHHRPGRPDEGQ